MSKYIVNMSAAFKHLCISVHLCWRNHREELPIVLVWKYKVKKLFQQEQSPSVQTWALSVKLTDKRSFGFHLDQWKLLEVLKVACDGWVAEFRVALCFHKCIILLFLRNVYCVRVRQSWHQRSDSLLTELSLLENLCSLEWTSCTRSFHSKLGAHFKKVLQYVSNVSSANEQRDTVTQKTKFILSSAAVFSTQVFGLSLF